MNISRLAAVMALGAVMTLSASSATLGTPATSWETPALHKHLASFVGAEASAITIAMQARSPFDRNGTALVLASHSSNPDVFRGDMSAIKGARFKVVTDGSAPDRVALWLAGASGRIWFCRAQFTTNSNMGVMNYVPFDRSQAVWNGPLGMPADQVGPAWAEDVANVDQLGVYVVQYGLAAQTLAIGQFRLEGEDYQTEIAQLTRLERILWSEKGVMDMSAVTGDIGQSTDSDYDGLTDLEERIAGTGVDDAGSFFHVKIRSETEAGALLEWPCVEGGTYNILSRAALDQPPQVLASGLRPSTEELAAGRMTLLVAPGEETATYYALTVE